jgi:hypothetical protein
LSVLLHAYSFIISEFMGVPEDMDYYRPGIVEVEPAQYEMDADGNLQIIPKSMENMIATMQFYLGNAKLRDEIALTGQRLFRSRTMADSLAPVIASLEADVVLS